MSPSLPETRRHRTRKRPAFRPQADALEGRLLLTAGDLDPTFGNGGSVLTSPRVESQSAGYSNDAAFGGVEVQPDGKILVAGSSSKTTGTWPFSTTTNDWGVVRLTPSGALDPTFGTGGRVLTTFALNDSTTQSFGTALQPDGKLVVVGQVIGSRTTVNRTTVTDYDIGVVRYLPSGALDPAFGPNGSGKVFTNFSTPQSVSNDFPNAVALQPDGKILVGGYSSRNVSGQSVQQPSMVRYNTDGTLDPTFGVGGKVLVTLSGVSSGTVKDFEALPDGRILVLGSKFLARYNADGSVDTTFGSGGTGVTVPNLGSTSTLGMQSMVVQADGGIVAGGWVDVGTNRNLALVKFTPAGVLDTSFAGTGAFVRDLGGADMFSNKGLRLQADGKILAVGYGTSTPWKTVTARFLPDGTLDATFGTGGLVVRGFGAGDSTFNAAALQPDGKLVAVGHGYSAYGSTLDNNFLVVRFLGDPAPLSAPSTAPRGTTVSSPGQPNTLTPGSLVPLTDQDLTALASEWLHAGRKRSRASLVS